MPINFQSAHQAHPRRAKIVCTLGPSTNTEEILRELIRAGMDVARLNFSHGTHEDHAHMIQRVRRAAELEGRVICLLQDLQGPKMRTGKLRDRTPVALKAGAHLTLTGREMPGTASIISTTFPIARDVLPGARILLSDGLIELRVTSVKGEDVETEVINGGLIGEHKGINLPGTPVSLPSITDKDKADMAFGLKHGIDVIAMSFVRTADDVVQTKRYIASLGGRVPVIAKLEKPQAIDNLEEIFEVSDAVMVARGDLGVEVPPERVPVIQKHVIRRAADWRKPVITATQMLESMIENPRPTRAEASDVANAIFDGTDAVMLSGETASGKYPLEAVKMMASIIVETEAHMDEVLPWRRRRERRQLSISETICESVAHAAEDLDMKAIAVFTQTGTTARLVSKYRPKCPTFAFAHEPHITNQANLFWGVTPIQCDIAPTAEDMVRDAEEELIRRKVVKNGDVMGVISGTLGSSGSTNLLRLHTVGTDNISGRPERRKVPRLKPATSQGKKLD
jgi:pyruvate kinase